MSDHRPRQFVGEVSAMRRPELVRAVDQELELRFVLTVPRWRRGEYDGRDYHRIVMRAPGTNLALSYAGVLVPGVRLHLHGVWRVRADTEGAHDELVVTRLWEPLRIPAGSPVGQPRDAA
ncbi:hypothetical protein [Streptomyces lydicus]|uniref:hypothetical protein n=1 Tax=Streptomyces lydicus TaxID=47763 RepID=UPI003328BC35